MIDDAFGLWAIRATLGPKGRRLRRDTIDSFERLAVSAYDVLAKLDDARADRSPIDAALVLLSGKRLLDLQHAAHIHDTSHLENRIGTLIRAYGLDHLSPGRERRGGRALILHAAEFRFLPFAEGALLAIRASPATARSDVRTVLHVVARWASDHDPLLSRLAAAALTMNGRVHPWTPLTMFLEAALESHLPEKRRTAVALQLSAAVLAELGRIPQGVPVREATVSEILAEADRLHAIAPAAWKHESSRRDHVLVGLVLDLELERDIEPSVLRSLDSLRRET